MSRDELAVLVHELRAPVAALGRLAEAAVASRDDAQGIPPLVELALLAARDVERLLGDPTLHLGPRETVPLARLVASVVAGDRGRVAVSVTGDPLVDVDQTRVRQALANVVGNALRHGERVTIAVGETPETAYAEVRDDGPGVADGFDPFVRGATGAGSTGLGLWVARQAVEAHGGTLELVDPGEVGGACFRLALPRASGGG